MRNYLSAVLLLALASRLASAFFACHSLAHHGGTLGACLRAPPLPRVHRIPLMGIDKLTYPSFGLKEKGQKVVDTAKTSAALFDLLTDQVGNAKTSAERKALLETVPDKIAVLESARVLFDPSILYDGPWRVLWKTGTEWQKYFQPFAGLADNQAYQWYQKNGSVTNIAQALGEKVYVTVEGSGLPATKKAPTPYAIDVEVSGAYLHAWGSKIPLNFIRGKGTTIVVYNDKRLRIFRSDTGGMVVQTKAEESVPM
ncbi:unnamed protein product [Discosporangium mesarthrocarpum]